MGRKCAVPGCLSEEGRAEDRGVTFHKIPLHSDIRPKWMSLCHIPEDKQIVKVVHVCSRHFLKANFCRFKGKKYMLRQGVLPSVFPWSKVKKDGLDDIKTETQLPENITIKEEENTENEPHVTNYEIKSEHMDFGAEETIGIKEEGSINNEALLSVASQDTDSESTPKPLKAMEKSSTTIEQKGKAIQTSSGVLNFVPNTRLEALDFNGDWFPARIVEIDYEDNEVLIHFDKYSSKYDEWISMDSCRLRPLQAAKTQITEGFVVGEKCLASWSDARKFPATVTKIIDKDTYEVIFNDGFIKVLKAHRMAKADSKLIGSAPLFEPVEGTKQDRRDKKRKLNVAKLFHKRVKHDLDDSFSSVAHTSAAQEQMTSPVSDSDLSYPRWENGRPIGIQSVIETSDGKKKSTIVYDPRLPPNWQKHFIQRTSGLSAGKWDAILKNPDGRKFRTRSEIKTYLEENAHLNYNEGMFDFSLNKRPRQARRSVQSTEPPLVAVVPEPPPVEVVEENPNSLKIVVVDDSYQCPIEGCGKNFRRENLAQMHVKHYHPEYTKFLDSTPNVADLAYARTVGESLDKSPDRNIKNFATKQTPRVSTPKASTPKSAVPPLIVEPDNTYIQHQQETINAQQASQLQRTKDSEILKLLNSKPTEDSGLPKYPPGLPTNMYPDIKLKDLLNKSEGIPKREDMNLKNLSTTRPTGIKTLLPVIRTSEIKKELETEKFPILDSPKTVTKSSMKRKRQISDNVDALKPQEIPEVPIATDAVIKTEPVNTGYIVEGGEVIKIVQMKSEEIINCTCGITEEDGLMIQCEVCLCWQHAYCNNIQRENQVPDNYTCYICQNPMRQRSSKKYFHDQDWLKNGTLPVAGYQCKDEEALKDRFNKLKTSHDLSGRLYELKDFMHSLKVKMKIAENKNHPKLYLWSKPWEKQLLPERLNLKGEENLDIKPDVNILQNQFDKSEIDLLTNKNEAQNESMLLSLLKSAKEEQKIKEEIEFNNLMANNLETLPFPTPIIPQPEAAIDSADCKLNLLDHIAHSQQLVEERLNNLDEQVNLLDEENNNTAEEVAKTCLTMQLLLKDLQLLKEFSETTY